jgi:hypothetical protein
MRIDKCAMVSDRNRQIIERRRSGESFSAIGSGLGISRERVRELFEREERRDQAPESLRKPPASPSSQIRFSSRCGCATCWPRRSEHPTLRPTTSQLLNIQVRCSQRSPILDCGIGKSLRCGWSVQESRRRFNAAAAVSTSMILDKKRHPATYGAQLLRSAKASFARRRVRKATAGYDSVGRGAMPSKVSYRRQPGKHLLFASISQFDPEQKSATSKLVLSTGPSRSVAGTA